MNPNDLIPRNIANFTRTLRRFGGMFDWNHTVDTTNPNYYRWTQWVFLKLHGAGLVERRQAPVNWCPSCKTVLANEQVIQGLCERCESPVEQRDLPQWFFRITDYAERLLANTADIDWSDKTRKAQINWIGRSEGAEVDFPLDGHSESIRVFTTRPDTLFGATYMVLAPEHPFVDAVTTDAQRAAVDAYRAQVSRQDLVERQKADKAKTGVFTGAHCINPVNGERIPVWIADYVLMGYGTGAIMAVPGHDERDFAFAQEFDLPIIRVIAADGETAATPLEAAWAGDGTLVNSGEFDGLEVADGKRAIVRSLEAKGQAVAQANFRLRDWCVSRQRYWGPPIPMVHCDDCGPVPLPESALPVELPHLDDFRPDDTGVSPLARVKDWYEVPCPKCKRQAHRDTDVTDNFLCSGWYFLRYPSTDRNDVALDTELTRKWLPVDSYIGGNEHAVLHLMYARFITMALSDHGVLHFDEPFTRFRAHGLLIREGRKMSKSKGNVITPDEVIERFGADTMRLYLLFLGPYEQGGDYQGRGIQGPPQLPGPPLAKRGRRRGWRPRPGSGTSPAPNHPAGKRASPGTPLQHRHCGDDGVPERGPRQRSHGKEGGARTPSHHARPFRPPHRRGTLRTPGPHRGPLRHRLLAGLRPRQDRRGHHRNRRPNQRQNARPNRRPNGCNGGGRPNHRPKPTQRQPPLGRRSDPQGDPRAGSPAQPSSEQLGA